ncbi:MAG: hypothetical protein IT427_06660 [Pirellulales bacterium]|nr:hypothetical protein [Pirellulales bacterium]
MLQAFNRQRLAWVSVGVLIGFLLAALMPARPLHAVATHGADGFALATGLIDANIEGVYFLDYLTGDLKGAVLNLNNGQFTTFYEYNVLRDLQVEGGKAPKFLMVTGLGELRLRANQFQPGESIIYVMEATSGTLAAYAVPWNRGRATLPSSAPQNNGFVLLNVTKFRNIAVRPQ